jgi:hypothetical protein
MTHPLIPQLRFARSEFQRALEGITDEEAVKRLMPMNCMSWMIAHLGRQEQSYWLTQAQGKILVPEVNEWAASGGPATTPPLREAWQAWHTIIAAVDPYLDTLTTDVLLTHYVTDGQRHWESVGTQIRRTTYHYFYHIGESQAIRQLMGHQNVGDFVGHIGNEAPYIPETP